MPKKTRITVPGHPHHVTQRGNRRQQTFFSEHDYRFYKHILSSNCDRAGVDVWAYVLMPNHIHLVAVPSDEALFIKAMAETHRCYAAMINAKYGWKGCLWQGRFFSTVMDERHLLMSARYIEMNPVRASISSDPALYPWSSAQAHLSGRNDSVVKVGPLLERVGDWASFLQSELDQSQINYLRNCTNSGRPTGDKIFYEQLKAKLGRDVEPGRRGRKKLR